MVAHDLRNPLQVASDAAELARETGDGEHLDRTVAAHERMEAIIDDLLTLARRDGSVDERDPVDLASVAKRAWDSAKEPPADLEVDVDRRVLVSEGRLQEVLENLLRNAVEHGGPDVTVEVGWSGDGFYVADDGPGLPAQDTGRVFERGYSDDDGTGLGLTIVERIAEAHGWTVEVTASQHGGARFDVRGLEPAS